MNVERSEQEAPVMSIYFKARSPYYVQAGTKSHKKENRFRFLVESKTKKEALQVGRIQAAMESGETVEYVTAKRMPIITEVPMKGNQLIQWKRKQGIK